MDNKPQQNKEKKSQCSFWIFLNTLKNAVIVKLWVTLIYGWVWEHLDMCKNNPEKLQDKTLFSILQEKEKEKAFKVSFFPLMP